MLKISKIQMKKYQLSKKEKKILAKSQRLSKIKRKVHNKLGNRQTTLIRPKVIWINQGIKILRFKILRLSFKTTIYNLIKFYSAGTQHNNKKSSLLTFRNKEYKGKKVIKFIWFSISGLLHGNSLEYFRKNYVEREYRIKI